MTFVSYAQNFEDVMLWRALRHVPAGFYIDAGAQHPDTDSVTRAFYERGWSGVNIEPVPEFARRIDEARLRDTTLAIALGSEPGHAVLQVVENTGLSTLDRGLAERHQADGRSLHEVPVVVDTLAAICRAHVRGPIHFLKIDVEGAERAVLEGGDFAAYRPWIVLLEATEPNSPAQTHAEWEHLLLAAGYGFVWFDGLNRFYVANEHYADLSPHFRIPPNVFDSFMRVADTEFAIRVAASEAEAARLRDCLAEAAEREARAAHEAVQACALSDWRGEELARTEELLRASRDDHAMENAAWSERVDALERHVDATNLQADALRQQVDALQRQVDALQRQVETERRAREAAEQAATDGYGEVQATRALLDATRQSTSWRVTAPLRRVATLVRSAPPPDELTQAPAQPGPDG